MSTQNTNRHKLWLPVWFFSGQLIAIALLISWLSPVTHGYWQQLDNWFFWLLNTTLSERPGWQYFMALANHRAADSIPALLVLVVFIYYCYQGLKQGELVKRLTQGVVIFVLLLIMVLVYKFGVIEFLLRHFGLTDLLPRRSGTYVFENAIRLDQIYPQINSKVTSKDSFPGDHATVLLFFTIFFRFYAGKAYGAVLLLISLIFIMPRLIGGAHWLSDILAGSGFILISAVSLFLATPIQTKVFNMIYTFVNTLLSSRWFNKLPFLKHYQEKSEIIHP